jgi:hypothetical protein
MARPSKKKVDATKLTIKAAEDPKPVFFDGSTGIECFSCLISPSNEKDSPS